MTKENLESVKETGNYNILEEREETKSGDDSDMLYVEAASFLESPYYLGDFKELATLS
jgi:hypothetical protein